jgi:hypothetical protein
MAVSGKVKKYPTPEGLQKAIDDYFESCWIDKVTEVTGKDGKCTMSTVRYQNRPYTVAGLCHYLGFVSRQSFQDYEKRAEFRDTIKRARLKIEMYHEEELCSKTPVGHIFWLKNNAGYRDKQDIEHTGANGKDLAIKVTFVEAKHD